MIPLRDVIPSRTFPVFTIGLIALNTVAFVFELSLSAKALESLLFTYGMVPARLAFLPVLTSMFLHSDWLHFVGNMLYLWIFGDNVEDRFGHWRFVVFYLACGAVAALAHAFVNPDSAIPTIGASGAIAGVLGAYFLMYPHSRVLALMPLFIVWEIIEVPAVIFLGVWFLIQFFSGVGSIAASSGVETGGVAFWAHIAGFVAGAIGVFALRKRSARRW